MDVERGLLMQIAVGGGATLLFVALVVAVGIQEGNRGLGPDGATLLVGVLVAFVVLLAVLGLTLGDRMSTD